MNKKKRERKDGTNEKNERTNKKQKKMFECV